MGVDLRTSAPAGGDVAENTAATARAKLGSGVRPTEFGW